MANKKKNKQKQIKKTPDKLVQEEVVETSSAVATKKPMSLSGFIAIILSAVLFISAITVGIIFAIRSGNKASDGLLYTVSGEGYSIVGIGDCDDENLIIPTSFKGKYVVGIEDNAFLGVDSIKTVTFAKGCKVSKIGDKAFANCVNLTSVTISDKVVSIGKNAFNGCTSLKSLTIGDKVNSIGERAFYRCTSLEDVTFKNTEGWGYNYPTYTLVSSNFFNQDKIIEWFNSDEDDCSIRLYKQN